MIMDLETFIYSELMLLAPFFQRGKIEQKFQKLSSIHGRKSFDNDKN